MAIAIVKPDRNSGLSFEREVANLYRSLGATVYHDYSLGGRQVDVYIEERTGSGQVRTVVECKDYKRRIRVSEVTAFATKVGLWRGKNLAEKFVLVARLGFTKEARTEARDYGVDLVEFADLQVKANREIASRDPYVWSKDDVEQGLLEPKDGVEVAPIEPDEVVNVALLREGRLPRLLWEFSTLVEEFGQWLAAEQRKRGGDRVRVLWLAGDAGPHRSKGLLACMLRAGVDGHEVHDAGRSFAKFGKALELNILTGPQVLPLIGVDLDTDLSSLAWSDIRNTIEQARMPPAAVKGLRPRAVVAGTRGQAQQAHDALGGSIEITTVDVRGLPATRPYSYSGIEEARAHVFNRGLPMTTQELFGREDGLARLRDAWSSEQTRILSIEAFGGIGKSALVNTWLDEMKKANYGDAERVLAWSFYSQGTKENLVSADEFVGAALRWFGIEPTDIPSPRAKGKRLAEAIKEHRSLLVLDGMEPLQHPRKAQDIGGRLTDESIRGLLEELARTDWQGLCVVTTRVPLTDLRLFEHKGTFEELELKTLEPADGAQLLERLIGKNPDREALVRAVKEIDGHALAITLLGRYLKEVHDGDLAGLVDLEKLTVGVPEGGHARRIMATYARWLKEDERFDALAILHLIGLFDRPAQPEAMSALLENEVFPFSAELDEIGGEVWNRCVVELRRMGLLNEAPPDSDDVIDAHPLVREHFQDELRVRDGKTWSLGNRTLYDYYRTKAPPQPASPEEMQPLYAAITHGCAVGLHQEVFDEVLLPRVWRDSYRNFSTRHLGLTGADLVALSNYFRGRQWTDLKEVSLSPFAQVLIRTNAGVRLRQLGRLQEAQRCFGSVLDAIDPDSASDEDLGNASYAAAQHSELLVIEGRLDGAADGHRTALQSARRAVEYADEGDDPYFRMHARTTLADVHFMLGEHPPAHALFEEAKAIERVSEPRAPFLYSQGLYRYGYYLIETNRAQEILDGEKSNADWGTNRGDSSLLSKAIRLLIGAAARRSLVEQEDSPELLDEAAELLRSSIDQFQTAGYADYVVRGLVERAHFYRVRSRLGDYDKAMADLDRATFEAERGQMHLLYTDILLQRAACELEFRRRDDPMGVDGLEGVVTTLAEAAELIHEIGYARRRQLLAALQSTAGQAAPEG